MSKRMSRVILSDNMSHEYIKERIKSGEPFSICRNGQAETSYFIFLEHDRLFHTNRTCGKQLSEIFDNIEDKQKYYSILKNTYSSANAHCVWGNITLEEEMLKKFAPNSVLLSKNATLVYEFFDKEDCWTKALEGKKVLVVSAFNELIEKQYKNYKYLHKNPNLLPEFKLVTVKSVWWFDQNKDSRFKDWFEALEYLYCQCMQKDFEIALISCGPFSAPLTERLKGENKQAIQMGGALQLLFGIKGKRWDHVCEGKYYNEYWVRPDQKSQIANPESLDGIIGGPYW